MGLILGWGSLQLCQSLVNELYILNSFTEVDILCFGGTEFKILFDFHKKSQNPVLLL